MQTVLASTTSYDRSSQEVSTCSEPPQVCKILEPGDTQPGVDELQKKALIPTGVDELQWREHRLASQLAQWDEGRRAMRILGGPPRDEEIGPLFPDDQTYCWILGRCVMSVPGFKEALHQYERLKAYTESVGKALALAAAYETYGRHGATLQVAELLRGPLASVPDPVPEETRASYGYVVFKVCYSALETLKARLAKRRKTSNAEALDMLRAINPWVAERIGTHSLRERLLKLLTQGKSLREKFPPPGYSVSRWVALTVASNAAGVEPTTFERRYINPRNPAGASRVLPDPNRSTTVR